MADNKTQPTPTPIAEFLATIDNPTRRQDAEALLALYAKATGMEPVLWGPAIIGYGQYHYQYDSGRKGDWMRAGFSPRKANISLYFMGDFSNPDAQPHMAALLAKLGKHKAKGSCLYITKLADVDMAILGELIACNLAWMDATYPR